MNIFKIKPSDFPKNPRGYIKNQLGHTIIGAISAALIIGFWLIAQCNTTILKRNI